MSAYDWLDRLLPKMTCAPDCGECCTVVAVHPGDYQRVMDYAAANGITPRRQGMRCPFWQNNSCAVYPARPFACRFYGHSDHLRCHRDLNVNVPEAVQRLITRRYVANNGGRDRFAGHDKVLHDAVYTREELVAAVKAELDKVTQITVNGKPTFPHDAVYDSVRQLVHHGDWPDPIRLVGRNDGLVEDYTPGGNGMPPTICRSGGGPNPFAGETAPPPGPTPAQRLRERMGR